jgi:hypothetical protein
MTEKEKAYVMKLAELYQQEKTIISMHETLPKIRHEIAVLESTLELP